MAVAAPQLLMLQLPDRTFVVGTGPFREVDSAPDEAAFYLNNFSLTRERPWLIPAAYHRLESVEQWRELIPSKMSPEVRWRFPDQETFKMVFRRIRRDIRRGLLTKMVPVLTQTGDLVDGDPAALVESLFLLPEPLHGYAALSANGGFLGATPERLLWWHHGLLETMALAGTASHARKETLSGDPKQTLEQGLVADWIESRLSEAGHVTRRDRTTMQAGPLHHLLTEFQVPCVGTSPEQWIGKLHPTPAVGFLPADQDTSSLYGEYREKLAAPECFAAPFGFREGSEMIAVVTIRGIFWEDRRVFLPSGCGIVQGSVFDHEWRELQMKRQSVRDCLGI